MIHRGEVIRQISLRDIRVAGDRLEVSIGGSKTDQAGNFASTKAIYTNTAHPHLSVMLALGIYWACLSPTQIKEMDKNNENITKLFQGEVSNRFRAYLTRFGNKFGGILQEKFNVNPLLLGVIISFLRSTCVLLYFFDGYKYNIRCSQFAKRCQRFCVFL